MNKKIVKYIYLTLIIIWMIVVFSFSNQVAEKSGQASGSISEKIVNVITKNKEITQDERKQLSIKIETPIRKLAHFSIYTIGGILIFAYINTFDVKTKNKFIYSISFGLFYACTDEFHQLFVKGRSGEIRDICIDSLGVLIGVFITYGVIQFIKLTKKKL